MSQLDSIVRVSIEIQADSISRTTFGVPGVMAEFLTSKTTPAFTRAREYNTLAELTDDGWLTTDAVYKMATSIFSQDPRPAKIVVGRRDAADASWAAAFAAIQAENDQWYGFSIVPTETVAADIKTELQEVATWVETQTKLFWLQSDEGDILNSGLTTDLFSVLKAAGRRRTVQMYRETTELAQYAPIGWFAEGAPYKPGSSTYAYKQIAGSTPSGLTPAGKASVLAKNGNTYTSVAGSMVTQKGVVAKGEFIDIVVFQDWLVAAIQEAIYSQLIVTRKMSYDDPGIVATGSIVNGVLEEGVRNGGIQSGSIVLTLPKYKDIPSADRAARKLTGIKFRAFLQGAAQEFEFEGTLSV